MWSLSLVKKSRGTVNTALTSVGLGRGQNDSSMNPTTGVTSSPLCDGTLRRCGEGGTGEEEVELEQLCGQIISQVLPC